jgi:methionyl-tRNA formyltransferase
LTALRIAFAGTPEFALPPLHALARSRHTLVGILTQPDRPKGRGQKTAASPVKQAALEYGVPVSQPLTLKTEEGRAELSSWKPDLLIVVAYGLILPPVVLSLPRLGCVNIHGSLLPRWRGAAPIHRAILAGDAETGVTIMQMDAGLDTGPMILKRSVPIGPMDTSGVLHDRLAELGATALLEALDGLMSGELRSVPQPAEGVTYAAKIEKSEARIDWERDALDIDRQVRAFNPWPIAETRLDGEQLRVYAARVEHSAGDARAQVDGSPGIAAPGEIIAVTGDAVLVKCGRGALAITEVQRPGKRPVSARDFANTAALTGRRLG